MNQVQTDHEIDNLVWSIVANSSNPRDFINYIQHAYNRAAQHEEALWLAETNWGNDRAEAHFPTAIPRLIALAEDGDANACFHLARWHRLGYGVEANLQEALRWYERGAELGSTRCMIALARTIGSDQADRAEQLLCQARDLGDLFACSFLADFQKDNYDDLLAEGAKSEDPFAIYCWGYQLLKTSQSDDERQKHMKVIMRAAELGESSACNFLSKSYMWGISGVEKDLETATNWARKGIKFGSEASYSLLGRILVSNPSTEQEGIAAWKRASILGDDFAQSALGWRYVVRGTSPEQQAEGIYWLREAVKKNNLPAYYRLADFLREGKGVEKNLDEAFDLLHRGTKLGSAECQASLGVAYLFGDHVPLDKEKGHNLLHLSRLQGYAWGTYLLGMTYENGDGVEKNFDKALECYREVADEEPRAASRIGYLYLWRDEENQDFAAAARWFMKAAEQGVAEAQLHLGVMLLNGYGVEENPRRAFKWVKEAADQGLAGANRELGMMYVEGKGVDMDRDVGMRYLATAASMGDKSAKQWLSENCPKKPQWLIDMTEQTKTSE